MIRELQNHAERLIDSVIELVYYMKGGLTYSEAMELTPVERQRMGSFLERRFKSEADALKGRKG